jgi:hypothetical protein
MAAFDHETDLFDYTTDLFDYTAEAELFSAGRRGFERGRIGYRRFARAGDAIRFAIEQLPPELLVGAYFEVDEARFDGSEIRRLYDALNIRSSVVAQTKSDVYANTSQQRGLQPPF